MIRRALPLFLVVLPLAASALDVVLQPTLGTPERMKDIGAQQFGSNYISTYTYANSNVSLNLNQSGLKYLDGTLTATGLKPNVAYQVKLAGKPSVDKASSDLLGKVGRWWRMSPTTGNSTDAEVEQRKNDPAYSFQGYLIIAFFVTDASGAANVRVLGNNSYHVLWRVDQRPPSANDGPLLNVTVPSTSGNIAYDATVAERSYQLYGEWEPNRALPGQLAMLDGAYNCELILTEESFHESGAFTGNWTAVLRSDLAFSIPTAFETGEPGPTEPPPSSPPLAVEKLRLTVVNSVSGKDSGRVEFTAALPAGDLNGLVVEAALQGVNRRFTLAKNGRAGDRFGRITAKRDKKTGAVRFRYTVSKTEFIFASEPLPAQPVVSVTLLAGGTRYTAEVVSTAKGKRRTTLKYRK